MSGLILSDRVDYFEQNTDANLGNRHHALPPRGGRVYEYPQ